MRSRAWPPLRSRRPDHAHVDCAVNVTDEPPRAHARPREGGKIRLLPNETRMVPVSEGPPPDEISTSPAVALWRWVRWNVVCLRGRKCADIEIGEIPAELQALEEFKAPPEVRVHFTCEGCGTKYLFSSKYGRSKRYERLLRR